MKNVKYRHRNCDRAFTPATFAYELPEAADFETMIRNGEPDIFFPFGATVLHSEDYYNKATGRKKSLADLQRTGSVEFSCQRIDLGKGRASFTLHTNHNKCSVELTVSVNFQTNQVRLEQVNL